MTKGVVVKKPMMSELQSVDAYMASLASYPLLTREEEYTLAHAARSGDEQAASQLVTANLRFVVKVAHEFRGYQLRLLDLIQEGNIGLIVAVQKFDPQRGYRLISYAVWWIRAYIKSFILRSWSLVKMGTTQAQRRLFFKLRGLRGEQMSTEAIAQRLSVSVEETLEMEVRMAGRDFSLDAPLRDDDDTSYLERFAASAAKTPEEEYSDVEGLHRVRERVAAHLGEFDERERFLVEQRLLAEEPVTLQEVGRTFRVSRERIRQIEARLLGKLRPMLMGLEPVVR